MHAARPIARWGFGALLALLCAGSRAAADDAPDSAPAPAPAEKPASDAKTPSEQKVLQELLKRLEKVESELARLRADGKQAAADRREQKLLAVLETTYFGTSAYEARNGTRFFAARLIFVNQTAEPVTIQREDISLQVDEATIPLSDVTGRVQYQSFQVGNQNYQLRNLKPAAQVHVPAGGTGSTWVVFSGIASGTQVPKMTLKIRRPDETVSVSVNEFALGLLGLTVERIGPRGSLALLTISGEMNTVNLGSILETLSTLTAQKVGRFVIRWTSSAPPVDAQLSSWLQQAAYQAGRGEPRENAAFVVPAAVRELHLSQLPSANLDSPYTLMSMTPRIHKTDLEAVRAALESAYEVLSLDELLAEIEGGHALTRAAALACGGGRLPSEKLPLILKYADDNDPQMQLAALDALQHFGDKEAIDKLVHYAAKNAEPAASAAVESLAASRYTAAHQALLEILKNEGPGGKKLIVAILARHPRPIWSDTIYEFVSHSDAELSAEALRALVRVGHPKLLEVLSQALSRGSGPLRDEAFSLLVSRTDRESEELAMNFTLKHLESSPPTDVMNSLLNRTKDPRAVPLLLAQLDQSPNSRQQIINTLARIGDQSVADVLVSRFPAFPGRDKAAVLNALLQLKSPAFRKLAGEALLSSDAAVVASAASGLQNDGSAEAIRLLVEALDKSTEQAVWSHVANALGTLGTPEAQAALRRARDSENANKRSIALAALQTLRQRSPGYGYVFQAQQAEQNGKWDEAAAHYGSAIELDPQLPEAYAGRGHALLMLNKHKEAHADFVKAVELDPYNSIAVTGMGVTLVLDGKIDEGIKCVEEARAKFPRDQLFFYNTACVYGRAVEALRKIDDKTPDRDKKIETCEAKAVEDLQNAVKLGFQNVDWMKKDPDLKSLHELPGFKKLVDPGATPNSVPEPGDVQEPESDELSEEQDFEDIEADINFLEAQP